jgi:hypothetical protein
MAERSTPSDAPVAITPDRPKVVYVMGSGRSGSTILGIALGNCADFFYAGELDNWLTRSGVPTLGGTERTQFWNGVRDRVEGAQELFGSDSHRYLERSRAVFRINRWLTRRRLRARYRRVTENLYRAIAARAGASYVVDTAHFPLRARELQHLHGIDLYLIFLVRDPDSVVASFTRDLNPRDVRRRQLRTLSTNADLWLTHLLSVVVFLRHRRDRRMFLRHEELLADPEGVLRDILDRLDSGAALPDLASLSSGLPLRANRLIKSEVVALEASTGRPVSASPLTRLLQLPWPAVFTRLRPTVTALRARGQAPTSDAR